MASNYVQIPPAGGGGGGAVDSVNGQTGVVVLTKSNIGLSNVDNTSDANKPVSSATQTALNLKADSSDLANYQPLLDGTLTGNKLLQSNNSGDVTTLESHTVNSNSGINSFTVSEPSGENGSFSVFQKLSYINPADASPDRSYTLDDVQVDIDTLSNSFPFGTAGRAVAARNANVVHNGTSDIGSIDFNVNNFSVGNGTDPIDVRGIGYSFGFGTVNANVNVNGPLQGYGFQPNVNAAATIESAQYTQAFYDGANINCASPSYAAFSSFTNIDTLNNNSNYTGVSIAPIIDNFTGNAGVTGVNVSPTLGTFNENGYFHGINVNPDIASARYAAGLNVTMDNVTAYAGVAASLVEQDLTFTFNTIGAGENDYTLRYTAGGTAGSEVVTLVGQAIEVQIEDNVSSANQIKSAMEAVSQLATAITITVSGTGSNAQSVFGPTNFAGGENPGQVLAAFLDGNVEIDGTLSFNGALSIGQLNAFASQGVVNGTGNPSSIHNLISNPTVGDNETITLGDTIGVNTAMILAVGTNSTVTSALVGLSALALPAVVNLGSGSTVDRVAGATFAISLELGAAGTIDNLDLCRAVGLPNGTTTVTRLKGYAMDLPFGDPGTTTWGFYESPGVNNYFQGNLLIGGTAGSDDTVTNSSVALEIKSTTKALLNARMTTSERDALTAINGMQIYNTTTDKLQVYAGGAWIDLH